MSDKSSQLPDRLELDEKKKKVLDKIRNRKNYGEVEKALGEAESSRRDFLQTLGLVTGGLALGALGFKAFQDIENEKELNEKEIGGEDRNDQTITGMATQNTNSESQESTGSEYVAQEHEIQFKSSSGEPVNYYFKVADLSISQNSTTSTSGGGSLTREFSLPSDGPYTSWEEFKPLFQSLVFDYEGPHWSDFRDLANEIDGSGKYEELTGQERNPDVSSIRGAENTYNITDYGADPSGSSDSADAIKDALSDATSGGSAGTVFIPEGTFLIEDEIRLQGEHSGVTVHGAGYDSVVKYEDDIGGAMFPVHDSGSDPVSNVTFSSFRLEGNTDHYVRGLNFRPDNAPYATGSRIENMWIRNVGAQGFTGGHHWMVIDGVYVENTGRHGIGCSSAFNYLYDDDDESELPLFDTWDEFRTLFLVNIVTYNCGMNLPASTGASYGIDMSAGRNFCSNFVAKNCGRGMKTSDNAVGQGITSGVVLRTEQQMDDNGQMEGGNGFQDKDPYREDAFLHNVLFQGNDKRGARIGNRPWEMGQVAFINNGNQASRDWASMGILIEENDTHTIDHLISADNDGVGLKLTESANVNIGKYEAAGNGNGALDNSSSGTVSVSPEEYDYRYS